ncbi:DNA helicase IV [Fibrobacteria bacterium R8-3-H12]
MNDYCDYRATQDFESLKNRVGDYNKKMIDNLSQKQKTIQGEFLNSQQEVQIANFLYMHGLDYDYEKPYPYPMPKAKKMLLEIAESNYKQSYKYKYIIIDEFQDIAKQRFNLTKALVDVTGAKVVAGGDDWQSIYAFAGSDITLFMKFLELMGDGKEMQITHTYRNSQELIDIAGHFVQKNPTQIKKRLISPKSLPNPIKAIGYEDNESEIHKNWRIAVERAVGEIVSEFGEKTTILMIGRYNFDYKYLTKYGPFETVGEKGEEKIVSKKYPKTKITFLTAHSSKGLSFDNVILVNMKDDKFGFPDVLADIYKCPQCSNGYMIVNYSPKDNSYFYGCTNFKTKKRCTETQNITRKKYSF